MEIQGIQKQMVLIIKNKNKKKLGLIKKFWKKLGSRTVLMKTKEHDNIFNN